MEENEIVFNRKEYLDKVLGCFAGKNIGGTLGAPFEGWKEKVPSISFYTQDLKDGAAPNDDLDLQLIWLKAMEDYGPLAVNEHVLAEYWMRYIEGPWNEYGIGRSNIISGLPPPLSGSVDNEKWQNSNGAWIRSEIWACTFPAFPEYAAWHAISDASVDHADEGVYAEMFTSSLESAAFVENDIRTLLEIGLCHIPDNCRVARAVKVAIKAYDDKKSWWEAREAARADSADLGWFQAPCNIAFMVIGLLYGEGDFGATVCTAVMCGDDTDCTGATAGAILGIINGYSKLPKKWLDPIGSKITTISLRTLNARVPKTIEELTERVCALQERTSAEKPFFARLIDGETKIASSKYESLKENWLLKYSVQRNKNRLYIQLPFALFSVEYLDGPEIEEGKTIRLNLHIEGGESVTNTIFKWHLPEGWQMTPAPSQIMMNRHNAGTDLEVSLIIGEVTEPVTQVLVEARLSTRRCPTYITIPFPLKGAHCSSKGTEDAAITAIRGW